MGTKTDTVRFIQMLCISLVVWTSILGLVYFHFRNVKKIVLNLTIYTISTGNFNGGKFNLGNIGNLSYGKDITVVIAHAH